MKKPELLAPAGSLSKLKIACIYGADAVYVGYEDFSLRTAADNFTVDELKEGVEFAHKLNKRVYLTSNIIPHNDDIDQFEKFIKVIETIPFDGIIIADLGMFSLVHNALPNLPIHISTQANNVNYATVSMWHSLGASRIVLARELSFAEIADIRRRVPQDMQLEIFVHGAMCVSYSGRCLLSAYMAGRDANKGACAHPCRWKYYLMEEKRPGEYMPVFENEHGAFIYNSKDLCMIEHIKELMLSGVDSFKIEGRVKTEYYVANVVKTYRQEIDRYLDNPEKYQFDPSALDELEKVSHRRYCTGFFLGKPDENSQVYENSSYIRTYDVVGIVTDYDKTSKTVTLSQRNKFSVGDELEIIQPKGSFLTYTVREMFDENGLSINSAPHAAMTVKLPFDTELCKDAILRKKRDTE